MNAIQSTQTPLPPLSRQDKINHWSSFFLCIIFAAGFFYGCKGYLQTFVFTADVSPAVQTKKIKDSVKGDIASQLLMIKAENHCLGDPIKSVGYNYDTCIEQYITPAQKTDSYQNKNSKNTTNGKVVDHIILVIEGFLVLGFSIQLYLFFYTFWLNKSSKIDYYIFQASDWAINTPPILGVLVNLLAFGAMLSQGAHNIQSLFSENFYLAIITTLVGGFIYVINMALKIGIQSRVDALYK